MPDTSAHEPATAGRESPLTAAEAAILLAVTEDEVLIRQRRGELPIVLTVAALEADVVVEM